ncbi:hypothetical protein Taro_018026 [Colocasia esculenta]|uniref:Neprosin PEP catalytic domain-containing protein n=1 Tax=Colocasia esculenta TaxID=4460 RepID=A0A843V174_COLES|nr:hypothetical protein [Colocasia esculenta]
MQDGTSGDLWAMVERQPLGYWPKILVPKLEEGVQVHSFGGEVLNKRVPGHHTSTQMGSGHFVVEGCMKATYTRNMEIVEARDPSKYISHDYGDLIVTHPNCYNLQPGHMQDLQWGFHFFFGRPDRSVTCT